MQSATTAEKADSVLREAARLFRKFGFHGTAMGDIGEVMGVNKGTLYHYFPSKSDMLFAIYEEVYRRLDANIAQIPADMRPDDKLVAYIRAIMKTRATMPDFVAVHFQEHAWLDTTLSSEQVVTVRHKEKAFANELRGIFEEGMRQNIFRRVNDEILVIQLLGTMSSLYRWRIGEDEASARLVAETIIGNVMDGIRR